MCGFNTLSEKAAVSYAASFYRVATHGFMSKNCSQLYLGPAVNFLLAWRAAIKPQLQFIKDTDQTFYNFLSYSMERVDKLRKFQQRLGPSSEDKKGEILQQE
jgi:hypothetical protein